MALYLRENLTFDAARIIVEGVEGKDLYMKGICIQGGVNKKSTVAANSGAKGAIAKPVSMTGDTAHGRTAPSAKDMGSTTQPNVKPAVKPHLAQAAGVNTKSVIQ